MSESIYTCKMSNGSSSAKLTVTGLAEYLSTPSASRQKAILRRFKFPDDIGEAPRKYYRDVSRILVDYFQNRRDGVWLRKEVAVLDGTEGHNSEAQSRINGNVRALQRFLEYFGRQRFQEAHSVPRLEYVHAGVIVKVTPDLYGTKRNRKYLVKYHFAKSADPARHAKITCQVMYGASKISRLGLSSSAIRVWDFRDGEDYRAVDGRSRIQSDVEDACSAIAAIWPTL